VKDNRVTGQGIILVLVIFLCVFLHVA